jgi:hypothetical protein
MAIISEGKSGKTKVNFFQNFQENSVERVNVKTIFSNMNPIIKDPIELKRVSKQPESSLNVKSLAKALGVFLTTLGVGFLTKRTNVFSYFKRMYGKSNSKNLQSSEITKVKNVISRRETLETIKETNNPFIHHAASNYKNEDSTVKFEKVEVEKIKDFSMKKENVNTQRSSYRRSISIQNPISNQNATVGEFFELTIDGNNVFNSSSPLFLELENFSPWLMFTPLNPNPTFKGSYDTPSPTICSLAVSDNYAYMPCFAYAGGDSNLQIIDIRDPSNPRLKNSYDSSGYGKVVVLGNYAYLTNSGLQIIDISNPSNPTLKGLYNTTGITDVAISGKYVYLVDNSSLQVIDISDPTNPKFKGSCGISPRVGQIAVSGNYAYVTSTSSMLKIIDISNPKNPIFKSSCGVPNWSVDIAVSKNYAYVTDEEGLQIIDISDPSNPIYKRSYDMPQPLQVIISGNYAYVTDEFNGLEIIDITDPLNPIFKSAYDAFNAWPGELAVSGNYVYIAVHQYLVKGGLDIIALNSDKIVLSGTPISAGTFGVDIKACNEVMECTTDSFDIIVKGNLDAGMDLSTMLAIIIPSVGACIVCTVSFSLLTIVGGIVILKKHRKEALKDKSVDINECKEEKELKKMDVEKNKKVDSSLSDEQKISKV